MEHKQLRHDASFAISKRLVQCIEGCLRPEEWADCFAAFYEIVSEGIARYEAQTERQTHRLHNGPPGVN